MANRALLQAKPVFLFLPAIWCLFTMNRSFRRCCCCLKRFAALRNAGLAKNLLAKNICGAILRATHCFDSVAPYEFSIQFTFSVRGRLFL